MILKTKWDMGSVGLGMDVQFSAAPLETPKPISAAEENK
jgi:hypothetical protein